MAANSLELFGSRVPALVERFNPETREAGRIQRHVRRELMHEMANNVLFVDRSERRMEAAQDAAHRAMDLVSDIRAYAGDDPAALAVGGLYAEGAIKADVADMARTFKTR